MNILIVGKTGQLGRELGGIAWPNGVRITQADRHDCDLTDPDSVRRVVVTASPDIVVNAAAYTAVDRAESEPELAMRANGEGPAVLARSCAESGAALIHVSTDYVFDGTKTEAYLEDDAVNPLSVYGRTKLAGERAVRELLPQHVIIRTSWVFSSFGNNFVKTMLRLGPERKSLRIVADQIGAPTAARDIARAIATIVSAISKGGGAWGTFHYASAEPVSWYGFAQAIFAAAGAANDVEVVPITSTEYGAPAPRPANSVLDCTRIREAYEVERPSWRAALNRTLAELETPGTLS